jgi:nucleoside-diphosphate-sugar epimerase
MSSGADGWSSAFEMNSQASGALLYHCRAAKGFVFCSTGSIYQYQGRRPLTESDPPGVPRLDAYGNYSFSKVAGEAVCTWVSRQFGVPLTIIRICSTYGPEGGTPADRFERMLAGKPIRLHPDAPNNFNPIYEDDYVELGIRALEVAGVPPVVVNWAGSETVSAEEYCTYMGELTGIEPQIVYDPVVHTALWPDVTYMHEVLGRTKVHWRDGFRRMIEARHPELPLQDFG